MKNVQQIYQIFKALFLGTKTYFLKNNLEL